MSPTDNFAEEVYRIRKVLVKDPANRSKETGRIDWARVLDAHPILIKRTPALVKARWERATRPAVATRRPPGCVQIR